MTTTYSLKSAPTKPNPLPQESECRSCVSALLHLEQARDDPQGEGRHDDRQDDHDDTGRRGFAVLVLAENGLIDLVREVGRGCARTALGDRVDRVERVDQVDRAEQRARGTERVLVRKTTEDAVDPKIATPVSRVGGMLQRHIRAAEEHRRHGGCAKRSERRHRGAGAARGERRHGELRSSDGRQHCRTQSLTKASLSQRTGAAAPHRLPPSASTLTFEAVQTSSGDDVSNDPREPRLRLRCEALPNLAPGQVRALAPRQRRVVGREHHAAPHVQ